MGGALRDAIRDTPLVHDAARAGDVRERFSDVAGPARDLLAASASCSGYLQRLMEREEAWLRGALEAAPEAAFAAVLEEMEAPTARELHVSMRRAKRRAALLVALADLGGVWDLAAVTGALTRLADRAVQLSVRTLIAAEIEKGKLPGCGPEDVEDAAGLFVLAMGKMGGFELNYSSDIDLIVFFDQDRHDPDDYGEVRKRFIRVTQQMVKLISEISGEGYVFRTDLRLRPDPSVTPVCMATDPAESYYESLGRTWERAAYIKARPCAGDVAAGAAFLERMRPFIWRRHLDYAAIEDAQGMWKRIRTHKGLTGPLEIPGHDIKLGQGGIREIEFFTQTRQLILGGRHPELRGRRTLPVLAQMAQDGWVDPAAAEELHEAYVAHRTLEHRLQMLEDAQTQTMPLNEAGMAQLAAFCGRSDVAAFEAELKARLDRVHELTEPMFETGGAKAAPEMAAIFAHPEQAGETMEGWRRLPALRSERARSIFNRLEPEILRLLSKSRDADAALRALDAFLRRQPSGVQLFSLLEANHRLLTLLIEICATTPELARHLSENPRVLDAVISQDFFDTLPGAAMLRADLAETLNQVEDYEDTLLGIRVWAHEQRFRIGVHLLRGIMDADEAGSAYSALAEACLSVLLPRVSAHFAERHGKPPGAGMAILAMGKLGSREMTATSDLDLIMIYDGAGVESSDGERPLATPTYYARLTKAVITALTSPMAEGILYKVDMRLRPSGKQGPLAVSLSGFETYQHGEAWTWEHLALTRARVVAGPPALRAEIERVIAEVIAAAGDEAQILSDVRDMRRRLAEAHERDARNPWEVKHGAGRMLDIELLAQAGALLHGHVRQRRPRQMLAQLVRDGWLAEPDAQALSGALERLFALQQIGRLASDETIDPREGGEGLVELVLAVTGESDLDALREVLAGAAAEADAILTRLLSRA